jgi:hypothetical protein
MSSAEQAWAGDVETALKAFLQTMPGPAALNIRTLAHAWEMGGGQLHVGARTVRLLARDARQRPFTAGTLHAGLGTPAEPVLELSRVILQAHGVGAAAWADWCDERPDLAAFGFDGQDKFPQVRLGLIGEAAMTRLTLGLRDLARAVSTSAAAPDRTA